VAGPGRGDDVEKSVPSPGKLLEDNGKPLDWVGTYIADNTDTVSLK